MNFSWFDTWISAAPLQLVGATLLILMLVAAWVGRQARRHYEARRNPNAERSDSQEAYIVSSVLGLMALLLGFTFSLAVDRFDARRERVLESANAVETTYLRAQLLEEPHRSRVSGLLVAYTDNVIKLGSAKPDAAGRALLDRDDQLLTDLWSASAASFDSIRTIDFSSAFLESMNRLIDTDAARRAARQAHVPSAVFLVLIIYHVVSAGALGYVLNGVGGQLSAGLLLSLMSLALLLVLDIDRPTLGAIRESQAPLAAALQNMSERPPTTFDKWRMPAVGAPAGR